MSDEKATGLERNCTRRNRSKLYYQADQSGELVLVGWEHIEGGAIKSVLTSEYRMARPLIQRDAVRAAHGIRSSG